MESVADFQPFGNVHIASEICGSSDFKVGGTPSRRLLIYYIKFVMIKSWMESARSMCTLLLHLGLSRRSATQRQGLDIMYDFVDKLYVFEYIASNVTSSKGSSRKKQKIVD